MKKLRRVIYIFLIFFTFSCGVGITKNEKSEDFTMVIVDGCEYMYRNGVGYKSLVHKGNCKNEIHKCNCK